MSVLSSSHFAVSGQSPDDAVRLVRDSLRDFPYAQYGVAGLSVELAGESLVIRLRMSSQNPDKADDDAATAAEEIIRLLRDGPEASHLREGQRELTLA